MAILQGQVIIRFGTVLGPVSVNLLVDGVNTLAAAPGVDLSVYNTFKNTIDSFLVSFSSVHIRFGTIVYAKGSRTQLNAIAQDYAADDTITLWQDQEDNWFATLSDTYWSDLGDGGVWEGFRIVSGSGLATLAEDPQHHVDTVAINMISPFTLLTMPTEKWHLYIPVGTDFGGVTYVPNYWRASDLLSALMKDTTKFVVSESQYLTRRAGDLRRWDRIPPGFLGQLIATLGCYLRLDMMDSERRRRLVYEWKEFLQYAGTYYFVDFLGFIYDTHFTSEAYWTNDYRNFQSIGYRPDPHNPLTVKDLPDWYPTNHVSLIYKREDWTIELYNEWSLIIDTFYKLASVPLVLHNLAAKYFDRTKMFMIMADHKQQDYIEKPPLLVITSTNLYMIAFDYRHIERSSFFRLDLNKTTLYMAAVDYRHTERSDWSPFVQITGSTVSLLDYWHPYDAYVQETRA